MPQEEINIAGNEERPSFRYEPANGLFVLRGRSRMDNPAAFYAKVEGCVVDALNGGGGEPQHLSLIMDFQHVKTSSAAAVRDVLNEIAQRKVSGASLTLKWVRNPGAANRNAATLIEEVVKDLSESGIFFTYND